MDPLLSSLAELGCEVRCEGEDGHFPFTLTAHGFGQDHISIDIGHSSQFLSALLIASTPAGRTAQCGLSWTNPRGAVDDNSCFIFPKSGNEEGHSG